jgi:hypothetical protein
MGRAERRHHLERIKAKVSKRPYWEHVKDDPVARGILANTQTKCSCFVCRQNIRAIAGPTMRERRFSTRGEA